MAALQHGLPVLPEDVLFNIFSRLDKRSHLVSTMLVRRAWYDIAERLQYSDITLKFPLFGELGDGPAVRCMNTLKTRTTAAQAVRHLALSGALTGDSITLLLAALSQTTRLLSLELWVSNYGYESAFRTSWQASCESSRFLPQLSAINTDDAVIATSVARGRPLYALGLPALIEAATFDAVVDSLRSSTAAVTQLRLYIGVHDISTAEGIVRTICRTCPSLTVLSIQLKLPKPEDVNWNTIETFLDGVEPYLSRLHSLRVLSLVLIPDPVDVASRYEERTREMARSVVDRFPQLHRVELRWHGWIVSADEWTPVRRTTLLRLLDVWFYAETRHRLDFTRFVIQANFEGSLK
ncbi:uncharacterized protein B0H18DRAFT_975963 [Fomitopsis serialis]|uniref:uncharacterized protein n=1 Tax=Fomitopsis serialis TaxID=139415 RepID=UPI00200750D3|nr:uncharacterized protein B0H18DRAFT_975963 [Neoantrodia serialis]KAH9935496.1 hypothetical protein B0H18DRAFT_975963 [Neoantrodia serialis]